MADPSVLKQAEVWRKKAEARRAELRAEYEALTARIEETTLTFTARAGDSGKLYGSVTTAQVTDALNEALGTDIDRRKVGTEPLRQLGEHQVVVRLSSDFQPHVTVVIESEDGEIWVAADAEELAEAAETDMDETEESDFDEAGDEEEWDTEDWDVEESETA